MSKPKSSRCDGAKNGSQKLTTKFTKQASFGKVETSMIPKTLVTTDKIHCKTIEHAQRTSKKPLDSKPPKKNGQGRTIFGKTNQTRPAAGVPFVSKKTFLAAAGPPKSPGSGRQRWNPPGVQLSEALLLS